MKQDVTVHHGGEPIAPERPAPSGHGHHRASAATKVASGYSCPMHPDIREAGPGSCPKCGMALEPVAPAATADVEWTCPMHPEIVRRRAGLVSDLRHGAGAAHGLCERRERKPELQRHDAAVLGGGRAHRAAGRHRAWATCCPAAQSRSVLPASTRVWLELALATPVVLWAAWPFFVRAVQSVAEPQPNMFTLIGLGVSVAYGYSLVAALVPGIFPPSFRDASGEVCGLLRGRRRDHHARSARPGAGASRSQPDGRRHQEAARPGRRRSARRIRDDGTEEDVPLDDVKVGDRLRVRPGREGPGGRRGASRARATSTSRWSRASRSRCRSSAGDTVIGATINGTGSLVMRAERVGCRDAARADRHDGRRGAAQPRADPEARRRGRGLLCAHVIAVAVVDVHRLGARRARAAPGPRAGQRRRRADHRLPVRARTGDPMSIMVATGKGATIGVLFKNAEAIELLRKVDTLVVDKTGHADRGQAAARQRRRRRGVDEATLAPPRRDVSSAASEHPLAAAIVDGRRGARAPSSREAEGFESMTGKGVHGTRGRAAPWRSATAR